MANPIALVSAGGGVAPGKPGARPTLERAALELYEPKPVPGGSGRGAPLGRIPFQFNPKELTIQKAAKWERKPARGAKTAGPAGVQGRGPLQDDAGDLLRRHRHDRRQRRPARRGPLLRCCVPTEASAGQKKEIPPLVVLHWGKVTSFHAFVTSVQAKYTLFTPDGTPIRATCTVALEEMPGEPPRQNPTSGSHSARATHTVVSGDTPRLDRVRRVRRPAAVAAARGVQRHRRPAAASRSGTTLLVPAADELLVV